MIYVFPSSVTSAVSHQMRLSLKCSRHMHSATLMRRPLRRASLTTLVADRLPAPSDLPERDAASSSKMDLALPSQETTSNPYLQSSGFSSAFRQHVATSGLSNTRPSSPGPSASVSTDNKSSLEELQESQSRRRDLFANSPTIPLKKSKSLLMHERQFLAKQEETLLLGVEDEEERQARRTAFRKQHKTTTNVVHVPLMPPQYLQERRLLKQPLSLRDDAEQLHLVAARNALVQSDEPQHFRCLRCFHIFVGRPSTLFADSVQQTRVEVAKLEQDRRDALRIAKRPSLRKAVYSVARQQQRRQDDPSCCPKCTSKKVQWAMEYVHQKTHSQRRRRVYV